MLCSFTFVEGKFEHLTLLAQFLILYVVLLYWNKDQFVFFVTMRGSKICHLNYVVI